MQTHDAKGMGDLVREYELEVVENTHTDITQNGPYITRSHHAGLKQKPY
jgi:hypothetical protein